MRTSLKLGTTALGAIAAASLAYVSFGAVGCTVTSVDNTDAGPGDAGLVSETGDTGGGSETAETTTGFAVIIPAKGLTTSSTKADEVHDFGGGSTVDDIKTGNRIYNAFGVAKSAGGTDVESTAIGKDAKDTLIDGRITGLPVGSESTITVTGYLRGLNGRLADRPSKRIAWAKVTCKATASATQDVTAVCDGPLKLLGGTELDGVVFTSDVLPTGYCKGKGATEFDLLRARTPTTGPVTVSATVDDCLGVIFVPAKDFAAAESGMKSMWNLVLEPKGAAGACTRTVPCTVDRSIASTIVIGAACKLDNTLAPPRTGKPPCFQ
ncbi:MAG: hypothetical protein NVSMB1_22600 [Polyangiales bacterium]